MNHRDKNLNQIPSRYRHRRHIDTNTHTHTHTHIGPITLPGL